MSTTQDPTAARAPLCPGRGTDRPLWLFRHGAVDPSWAGRIYGGLDVPLSIPGRRQSRRLARAFRSVPFERILTSPLERARVLARLLSAATGAPVEVVDELREIERGRWSGREAAEIQRTAPDEVRGFRERSWTFVEHGGECDGDVWRRAWPRVEAHVAAGRGPLAIVGHYNLTRVLVAAALGIAPRDSFRLRLDAARAIELVDRAEGWRLRRLNVPAPPDAEGDA